MPACIAAVAGERHLRERLHLPCGVHGVRRSLLEAATRLELVCHAYACCRRAHWLCDSLAQVGLPSTTPRRSRRRFETCSGSGGLVSTFGWDRNCAVLPAQSDGDGGCGPAVGASPLFILRVSLIFFLQVSFLLRSLAIFVSSLFTFLPPFPFSCPPPAIPPTSFPWPSQNALWSFCGSLLVALKTPLPEGSPLSPCVRVGLPRTMSSAQRMSGERMH